MSETVEQRKVVLKEAENAMNTWSCGKRFIEELPEGAGESYKEAFASGMEYLNDLGFKHPQALLGYFYAQMMLLKTERDTWGIGTTANDELAQNRVKIQEACYWRTMDYLIASLPPVVDE
jgi:hypothetical protein